jgi:hypothetical protein
MAEQKQDTAAQTGALQHHVTVDAYLDYSKIRDTVQLTVSMKGKLELI